jgi:hypothetical protein
VVMKDQNWSIEEEKQLREMSQAHRRLNEIAAFFGKSPESVKKKIKRPRISSSRPANSADDYF